MLRAECQDLGIALKKNKILNFEDPTSSKIYEIFHYQSPVGFQNSETLFFIGIKSRSDQYDLKALIVPVDFFLD